MECTKQVMEKLTGRVDALPSYEDGHQQLQESRQGQQTLETWSEVSQTANTTLARDRETERIVINCKYHKDVDAQVEERVQQQKARLTDCLRTAEAKAQQYDAATCRAADLQK